MRIHMLRRGLSLVEIIISMLILSIAVAGGYSIFVSGKGFIKGANIKAEAIDFAGQKIEELQGMKYQELPSSGTIDIPSGSEFQQKWNGQGTYSVTLPSGCSDDCYKIIKTRLTWTEASP